MFPYSKLALFLMFFFLANLASAHPHPSREINTDSNEFDSQETFSPFSFEPVFLEKLSRKAKKEYNDIIDDEDSTVDQIEQELQEWAQKYNVTNQLNKYETTQRNFFNNLETNVQQLVGSLPNVLKQLTQLLKNTTQTVRTQQKAIKTLSKEYPDGVATLLFIATLVPGGSNSQSK